MKYLIVLSIAVLLAACAGPRPTTPSYYLNRADDAIAQQNWEAAYRDLEDGLVNSQPEIKNRALNLIRQNPQVLSAGAKTFSKESVLNTVSASVQGESLSIEGERRRLESYKVVATTQEYEIAKSNIDSVAIALNARRREEEHKKNQAKADLIEAAREARFSCQGKSECEKAFSLTQIFLSENADMKIQVATDTIIETYNPTGSMKIGLKAVKMPRKDDAAEIILTATCRDEGREALIDLCGKKLLSIYRAYPRFLQTSIRP